METGEGTQLTPGSTIINAIGVRLNSFPVTPEKKSSGPPRNGAETIDA